MGESTGGRRPRARSPKRSAPAGPLPKAQEGRYDLGLVRRLLDIMADDGVTLGRWGKHRFELEVCRAMAEIQDRLYQHVISELCDLARQLHPPGERHIRLQS